jgi:hypothetical protein
MNQRLNQPMVNSGTCDGCWLFKEFEMAGR